MSVKFIVYKDVKTKKYSGFFLRNEDNALVISAMDSNTAKQLYLKEHYSREAKR